MTNDEMRERADELAARLPKGSEGSRVGINHLANLASLYDKFNTMSFFNTGLKDECRITITDIVYGSFNTDGFVYIAEDISNNDDLGIVVIENPNYIAVFRDDKKEIYINSTILRAKNIDNLITEILELR